MTIGTVTRDKYRRMKIRISILCAAVLLPALCAAVPQSDKTADILDTCLASPKTVSTADNTNCYATAQTSFDHRLTIAYRSLLQVLPASAAQRLRTSQRTWIIFRDAELATQSSLFETRQGTMYVPMQEEERLSLTRDRALRFEAYLRVLSIDGP